jgi:hypothetical protein
MHVFVIVLCMHLFAIYIYIYICPHYDGVQDTYTERCSNVCICLRLRYVRVYVRVNCVYVHVNCVYVHVNGVYVRVNGVYVNVNCVHVHVNATTTVQQGMHVFAIMCIHRLRACMFVHV